MNSTAFTMQPEQRGPRRRIWQSVGGLHHLRGAFHFTPAVKNMARISFVVYLLQSLLVHFNYPPGHNSGTLFNLCFGLHWPLLRAGCFWQPLSYAFLHGSWLHLALNMVTLLFFGSAVEALVGSRRFWQLYLVSAMVAGLGWMLFNWLEPSVWLGMQRLPGEFWQRAVQQWAERQPIGAYGVCVGASGAVFGLIGAYATLVPHRRLMVLLFFVIPLKMEARTLALVLMIITVIQLVVGRGQIAYSAHLIGCLAGYLLARYWKRAARGRAQ